MALNGDVTPNGPPLGTADRLQRSRLALVSGWMTILVALGAALLPLVDTLPRTAFLGSLLLVASLVELVFGAPRLRDPVGRASAVSGAITALAGILFLLSPDAGFFPVAPAVTAWLLVRGGCVLALALPLSNHPSRWWLLASAGVDILLGLLLLSGLRITTLSVLLFGPTRAMVASFALILALSFAVTGLVQVASGLERRRMSPE